MYRDYIEMTVNGRKLRVSGEAVFQPLSTFLREDRLLTGTKVVCAEGDCGACTVMVARDDRGSSTNFTSLNSCIAMTFLLDGADIVTVEGLREDSQTCEIQSSMVRNFGSQCGFCTPGFVMALTDLFENKEKPDEKQVKNYLTGNLCRCTGYQPIIQAALDVDADKHHRLSERYPVKLRAVDQPVKIESGNKIFFAPVNLAQACRYKLDHPEVTIFSGSTDLGVRINKGHLSPRQFMSLSLIGELYGCRLEGDEIVVGAKATLSEFSKFAEDKVLAISQFLNIFASPQIKNSATLIGNLANASPIADTTPLMMSLEAVVDLMGVNGGRSVPLKDFYLGYKKLDLKPDEIITHVRFKKPNAECVIGSYKISQRRDLDISCVNASFILQMDSGMVRSVRMSYGGVGPVTLRLMAVEDKLRGRKLDRDSVEQAKQAIGAAIKPISDARGSAEFRTLVAQNLFEKFVQENFDI